MFTNRLVAELDLMGGKQDGGAATVFLLLTSVRVRVKSQCGLLGRELILSSCV